MYEDIVLIYFILKVLMRVGGDFLSVGKSSEFSVLFPQVFSLLMLNFSLFVIRAGYSCVRVQTPQPQPQPPPQKRPELRPPPKKDQSSSVTAWDTLTPAGQQNHLLSFGY